MAMSLLKAVSPDQYSFSKKNKKHQAYSCISDDKVTYTKFSLQLLYEKGKTSSCLALTRHSSKTDPFLSDLLKPNASKLENPHDWRKSDPVLSLVFAFCVSPAVLLWF